MFVESPALKYTEKLQMYFEGPIIDGDEAAKDFIPHFIKAASTKANILE